MRMIGLAGWSGAGKTTLLRKLIPELTKLGMTVSTLKHAHHAFDVDMPGKDSFEHRQAGATEVLISSGRRFALMHELRGEAEPSLAGLLGKLSPVALVIVEGFKREDHAKIQVWRSANGKPRFGAEGSLGITRIVAEVSDLDPDSGADWVHMDDIPAAAKLVLRHAETVESFLARCRALKPAEVR